MLQDEINEVVEKHQHFLRRDVKGWTGMRADFSKQNLTGIDFSYMNLSCAVFSNSNLSAANFHDSNLSFVKFNSADLSGVVFSGANLCNSDFSHSNLSYANMNGANLCEATLNDADLRNTDLMMRIYIRLNYLEQGMFRIFNYHALPMAVLLGTRKRYIRRTEENYL